MTYEPCSTVYCRMMLTGVGPPDCEKAFVQLKSMLSSDPLLMHYDSTQPIIVAADSSNHRVGAVISHTFPDGRRNPRVPPVAVWSSARQFQTILIHPHMMRDHLPNSITGALERLHKAFLSASPHSNLQLTSQGACLLPEGLSDPAHLVRRIKNAAR
ncbi:unnamed protein product [Schistocephalus solidus]|uniref:RT_RNaseH_2 domain-containing protein n=1 Tax=Schistocephalus solidus TaxID=70667 RepID=A0A183TNJ1_SCHSO|nr:unnamed protein product [Schistocephalus solidus]